MSHKNGVDILLAVSLCQTWSQFEKSGAECGWTLGHLLTVTDKLLSDAVVTRVVTSRNERFTDPVHEVPIDSPIQLCEQYTAIMYVSTWHPK